MVLSYLAVGEHQVSGYSCITRCGTVRTLHVQDGLLRSPPLRWALSINLRGRCGQLAVIRICTHCLYSLTYGFTSFTLGSLLLVLSSRLSSSLRASLVCALFVYLLPCSYLTRCAIPSGTPPSSSTLWLH